MKNIWKKVAVWALLGTPLLLSACDKNDEGSLEGQVTPVSFTVTTQQVGFTTVATFVAPANFPSSDVMYWQWEFGDGTTGKGQTVTHVYTGDKSGTLKAYLVTSSRAGTSSFEKDIVVPSSLEVIKSYLTGATSKAWTLSPEEHAITVGTKEDPATYYGGGPANSLPACQGDDEFIFSVTNEFTYDAKDQTFIAGADCAAPRSNKTTFTYGKSDDGALAMFTLKGTDAFSPFIGVTDAPDLTYQILDITENTMRIQVTKPDGTLAFVMKLVAKS